MSWKTLFGNLVAIALGLLAFDALYHRGGPWWEAAGETALLMAGACLGDPWKKPAKITLTVNGNVASRADAPRES